MPSIVRPPHRHRHEAGFRGTAHHVENDAAVLVARRDVEEGQFIGASPVIGNGRPHWIAGVAQIDEVDSLNDAAILHVEAGNQADLEHGSGGLGFADELECLRRVESSVIERAAGDGAFELLGAGL